MEISLQGRRAFVGGASNGLGKAIAIQLAKSGAEVTLVARNEENLKALTETLSTQHGQNHQYLVVDFNHFNSLQSIISTYFESHQIDILVNNTNGPSAGTVWDKTSNDYQQAFDLLFKSVNHITMEAIRHMRDQQFGRIINLSSITVKEPAQNLALSNSIRAAVITWAKTLAREVAGEGITVNNILTGYFETERLNEINRMQAEVKGIPLEDYKDKMKQDVPAKRFGRPEEFAWLVTFLASGNAAYITGNNIPIDGGLIKSV